MWRAGHDAGPTFALKSGMSVLRCFRPVRRVAFFVTVAFTLPAGASAQIAADRIFIPGTVSFSANVGGVAFTDFRRTAARAASPIAGDAAIERRISAQPSLAFGAGAGVWIGHAWGVRLEGSYAPTRFDVETAAESGAGDAEQVDGAGLDIWTAEAHLLFRLPFRIGRMLPYGVLGGGAAIYGPRGDAEKIPYEARASFAGGSQTRPAAVAGLGGVLPLERYGLLLRFELTNLITRTPVGSGAPGVFQAEDGLQTVAESDRSGGTTNHVRFTLGLVRPLR